VHLLRYVVKCTVTDSLFNIQASCSKCPTSAWIPFLTRVTRELLTLRSTAVLRKVRSSLVTLITPEPLPIGPMCILHFSLRISYGIKSRSSDLNSWDTLYIHLPQSLRMSGAIHSLSLYAFAAWAGTTSRLLAVQSQQINAFCLTGYVNDE